MFLKPFTGRRGSFSPIPRLCSEFLRRHGPSPHLPLAALGFRLIPNTSQSLRFFRSAGNRTRSISFFAPQNAVQAFWLRNTLSGCRESNSVYLLPKQVYCHHTPPRQCISDPHADVLAMKYDIDHISSTLRQSFRTPRRRTTTILHSVIIMNMLLLPSAHDPVYTTLSQL